MKRTIVAFVLLLPSLALAGGPPPTLFQMAGVKPAPVSLSESVLVIIDAQQEYVNGALPLAGIDQALVDAGKLLKRARAAGTPVIHVVHRGAGKLFDPVGPYFAVVTPLAPVAGRRSSKNDFPTPSRERTCNGPLRPPDGNSSSSSAS